MSYKFTLNGKNYYMTEIMEDPEGAKDVTLTAPQQGSICEWFRIGDSKAITWPQFVAIWNKHASLNGWKKITEANKAVDSKFRTARFHIKTLDDWDRILSALANDDFFGKRGKAIPNVMTLFHQKRYFMLLDQANLGHEAPTNKIDSFFNSLGF